MKSILISIQPKWCDLIARGKKKVEVRKTKPKLETPFKCYIYCTKDSNLQFWTGKRYSYADDHSHNLFDRCGNGKVIGEFVCDTIITDRTFGHDALFKAIACMSDAEIASYCTNNEMYGWHISDLVIYDKPKELSEFTKVKKLMDVCEIDCINCGFCKVKRPPQSWCYVEEMEVAQ